MPPKPKSQSVYECQACGARSPKWVGRCADCGGWSTVAEVRLPPPSRSSRDRWAPAPAGSEGSGAVALLSVEGGDDARFSSTIEELDRVLGGGIVAGSAVLVGG